MAQESKRGCGYRIVGGLYLVGGYIPVECDRLPYSLDVCPVCGAGVKVSRAFTQINPFRLFGSHAQCSDNHHCRLCDPLDGAGFIMRVGEKYYRTPGDFTREALAMGVSKRIPFVPKGLELGTTPVFLAHKLACRVQEPVVLTKALDVVRDLDHFHDLLNGGRQVQQQLVSSPAVTYKLGIFAAFTPMKVEKLIWQHDATEQELEKLAKRGITPVVIPDGDMDHARGFNK